jgi:chromosome segregation ATPase
MVFLLSGEAFADRDAEIRDLKFEKEKLNSEIQKLNRQIASTDSMLKADDSRYKMLSQRYKADTDRRRAEIDSLNAKIRGVAEQLQVERSKQARAKNRGDNVAAKRKALREALAGMEGLADGGVVSEHRQLVADRKRCIPARGDRLLAGVFHQHDEDPGVRFQPGF